MIRMRLFGAGIAIMIHPNYQYDGSFASLFAEIIEKDVCDIILGSRVRIRKECLGSRMPLYKYLSNRVLTILENLITGQNLLEWHTGHRAYSRKVLETIPYHKHSNESVFDSQFLMQAASFGFKMGDLPVPCRYMREGSSINLGRSIVHGFGTIRTLFQFILQRLHLMKLSLFSS